MVRLSTLHDKAFDVPYHLGRAMDFYSVYRDKKQGLWHLQAARAAALRVLKLIDERLARKR